MEDAFQATFLILVRKAATIGDGDLLETWLYKVATRVALRARAEAGRRRDREMAGAAVESVKALDEAKARPSALNHDELRLVLDEEIGRLPEKYRAPLVLFHLRGLSQAETARRLGCPAGTVGSRLAACASACDAGWSAVAWRHRPPCWQPFSITKEPQPRPRLRCLRRW